MQSRFGLAEVVPLVAVGLIWIGIEVVLAGADLQLWGGPDWRSLAYRIGGFRPGLLRGAPPDFAIQPGTMFLSYAFLHGGVWHLAGNLLALATLGPALLPRLGAGRVLLVLFVSTLAGGLAFALLSPDQTLMVGASGGLFGLFGTLGSALLAAVVGVGIGCYTGYRGGLIDMIALRASEIFMAFPQIILVLLLVSIAGQSLMNLMVIFVATGWAPMYRMVRARMLSLRVEEYVQALQSFGVPVLKICYKHILPNALGPIMVNITLTTAMFILAEAGLSFLGLGVPLSIPTWGNILNVAQDIRVLQNNWWMWLPVGAVISLFVLSVNFIGDGLRDSTDPSLQG